MLIFLLYVASPIIVYSIMRVLCKKNINEDKKLRNLFLIINGIIMALMIGLRHPSNGSGDTRVYLKNWVEMQTVSFLGIPNALKSIDFEPGYLLTVWLLSHVFKNPQMLLILSGVFFAFSVCRFLKLNCKNLMLGLLVFNSLGLFIFFVQGLRQSIAMCICLFAIEHCKKKKIVPFLITVIIAALYHASAICFLIVYFVNFFKVNAKSFILFGILALIFLSFIEELFEIFNYLLEDHHEIGKLVGEGGIVAIIIYLAIILFGFIFYNKKQTVDNDFSLYIYLAIIGMITLFLRNNISTIVERIGQYFAFSQIIIISNALFNIKDNKIRRLITLIIVLACLGVAMYKASYSVVIPYNFFWM